MRYSMDLLSVELQKASVNTPAISLSSASPFISSPRGRHAKPKTDPFFKIQHLAATHSILWRVRLYKRHRLKSTSTKRMSLSLKRRYPFGKTSPAFSIETRPPIPQSSSYTPSFSKIFDMDVEMTGCEPSAETGLHFLTKTLVAPALSNSSGLLHLRPRHQQHDSVSTISATSSTNSSPTTTVSTTESNGDRSPSTSPDSPISSLPLPSFPSRSPKGLSAENVSKMSTQGANYRSLSPIKKTRNSKNLSLNGLNSSRPSTATQTNGPGSAASKASSAPSSPGFIAPPMPRRRPSNLGLTIKLPSSLPDKASSLRQSSVATRPSLRHHMSSPSLFSPAPTNGSRPPRLFSPPPSNVNAEQLSSSLSSSCLSSSPSEELSGPIIEMDEEDMLMMENDGEGPKSPSYPEGPVCIYEPNIYLFSEPNAELAAQFDVIVNVAREVPNPFEVAAAVNKKEGERQAIFSPALPTGSSVASFATAFEDQETSSRVTTPRATEAEKRPEYIHIPWDHNTTIVPDLPELVELLQKRTVEGKKILVHCQCGVSRSASLIVAYGLFKNSKQTVQEAYDFVKEKSRWIGPNMSLIYQLSDWRAKITAQSSIRRSDKRLSGVRGAIKGQTIEMRPKLGHHSNNSDPTPFSPDDLDEPMTAPLPHLRQFGTSPTEHRQAPRSRPSNLRTKSENGAMIQGIEPGPMSAPPGMINIPGSRSVENHGASWGSGDAGTGYVPPPLPPSAAYPLEQESDIVGNIVGFPARRGNDDDDGLPPPTPSFGPNGGFRFERPLVKSLRKKRFPALAESADEPPPTPSLYGPKGGYFDFKKSTTPPPPAPEPMIRKTDIPARPNPAFHTRFPSIMSSFDEPPPTPSLPSIPVRMPTITARKPKSSSSLKGLGRGNTPVIKEGMRSPLEDTGVAFFSDPRSPNTGRGGMPTTRSIFDVL